MHLLLNVPLEKGQISKGNMHRASDSTRRPQLQRHEGELFAKRQELIKPIQDKVYNAIEQYANDRSYEFIFDRANSTTLLFASPKNDKTQDILKRLGAAGK